MFGGKHRKSIYKKQQGKVITLTNGAISFELWPAVKRSKSSFISTILKSTNWRYIWCNAKTKLKEKWEQLYTHRYSEIHFMIYVET